jgi:hypothetical protein
MSFFNAMLGSGGFNPILVSPYLWEAGSGYNSSTGAWTDSSTHARNGSQATSGARPTTTTDARGNTLLVSDGSDDYINSGITGATLLNGDCSFWILTKPADGQPASDQTILGNQYFEITLKTDGSIYVRLNNATDGTKIAQTISGVYADGSQVMNLIRVDVNYTLQQIFIYVGNTLIALDATNNGDIDAFTAANFSSATNLSYFCKNNNGTQQQFYAGSTGEIYVLGFIPTATQANNLLAYFLTGSFPALQTPADPSGCSASATDDTHITVSWTDNAGNETNYEVYRSTDNVTFTKIASPVANSTSYADSGLTSLVTYYYKVRAWSTQGHSNYVTANATTPAPALNELNKLRSNQINLADATQIRFVNPDNFLLKWNDESAQLNNATQGTNASQPKVTTTNGEQGIDFTGTSFETISINGGNNFTQGDFEIWLRFAMPNSSTSRILTGILVGSNGIQIAPSLGVSTKLSVRMFGSGGNKRADDNNVTFATGGSATGKMLIRVTFTWATKQLQLYKCNVGDASLPQLTLNATNNGDCSGINFVGLSTATLWHINGYSSSGTNTSPASWTLYERRVFSRILSGADATTVFNQMNV